jgi:hypothetical protein
MALKRDADTAGLANREDGDPLVDTPVDTPVNAGVDANGVDGFALLAQPTQDAANALMRLARVETERATKPMDAAARANVKEVYERTVAAGGEGADNDLQEYDNIRPWLAGLPPAQRRAYLNHMHSAKALLAIHESEDVKATADAAEGDGMDTSFNAMDTGPDTSLHSVRAVMAEVGRLTATHAATKIQEIIGKAQDTSLDLSLRAVRAAMAAVGCITATHEASTTAASATDAKSAVDEEGRLTALTAQLDRLVKLLANHAIRADALPVVAAVRLLVSEAARIHASRCQQLIQQRLVQLHKDAHVPVSRDAASHQITEEQQRSRQRSMQLHLQLLQHASGCRNPSCPSVNCSKMKNLLKHGATCQVRVQGGCNICQRAWALLRIHARECRRDNCIVPACRQLKEELRATR